jgi:hypothetical protein
MGVLDVFASGITESGGDSAQACFNCSSMDVVGTLDITVIGTLDVSPYGDDSSGPDIFKTK